MAHSLYLVTYTLPGSITVSMNTAWIGSTLPLPGAIYTTREYYSILESSLDRWHTPFTWWHIHCHGVLQYPWIHSGSSTLPLPSAIYTAREYYSIHGYILEVAHSLYLVPYTLPGSITVSMNTAWIGGTLPLPGDIYTAREYYNIHEYSLDRWHIVHTDHPCNQYCRYSHLEYWNRN